MAKRVVVSINEMYRRRAVNWEWHYQSRGIAQTYSQEDREKVIRIISHEVPAPVMRLDGAIMDGIANLRGTSKALHYLLLSNMERSMMCVWYWSEAGWMELVREFQALPDIYEDHYYAYDAELDAVRFLPMCVYPRRGRKHDHAVALSCVCKN